MAKKKITGKPASKKATQSILKWFETNPEQHLIVTLDFSHKEQIRVLEKRGTEYFCNLNNEHILVNLDKKKVTTFGSLFTSGINSKNDVPWSENELPSETEDTKNSDKSENRHSTTDNERRRVSKQKVHDSSKDKDSCKTRNDDTGVSLKTRKAAKGDLEVDESKPKTRKVSKSSTESKLGKGNSSVTKAERHTKSSNTTGRGKERAANRNKRV